MPKFSRRKVLQSGAALTTGGFLLHPSLAGAARLAEAARKAVDAGVIHPTPEIDLAPREHLLFDFDWRFTYGNANDPAKDLNFGGVGGYQKGNTEASFAKTGRFALAQPQFDDSGWRRIDLPHDWGVELPFVDDPSQRSRGFKPLGRDYPETSVGWYRRTFHIPIEDQGRRIYVDFDGAFRNTLVFCNGVYLGRNDDGYTPFGFDLSNFLNYGGENAITVRVDASFGGGWFYEGAGIYRHVWLTKVDTLHFAQWETVVRTEVRPEFATLQLSTIIRNTGDKKEACRVRWQILDPTGKVVANTESPAADVDVDGQQSFKATAKIAHPALWTLEQPNLYYAVAAVETNGKIRDRDKTSFGVRTLAWDLEKGFLLNGKKTPIHGTCNHQDHAGVGTALPDRLQSYRLEVLKEMGCNAIRTSHNMPTPELMEASDRLGLLVLCETRTMSSTGEAMEELSRMVRRFRNHPSIFLWSMGNEEGTLQRDAAGPRVLHAMQQRAHELDPTRLCTAAVNAHYDTPCAPPGSVNRDPECMNPAFGPALDVMGFNYNLWLIDLYRNAHRGQPCVGTEVSSATSTRGMYSTDKSRNWLSSYNELDPRNIEALDNAHNNSQGLGWWPFYHARPWLSGGFIWTGFDYRGEPSPYGWPSISSQFGSVDTCGYPKDAYYYYKAWWGSEPVLHLLPHWNWFGREGEEILVQVESNLDSVELFLNSKSLGSQKVVPLFPLSWKVTYVPGILEARGSRNGRIILTATRRTSGAPARIVLTADRDDLSADGEDVAIIRVETVDKDGLPVPTAEALIQFQVSGAGRLIGVGNGDPNCLQSDKKPERSLFSGLAAAILQTTKTPGTLVITATSHGLEPASLSFNTRRVNLRPFVV
jgi:beta-galactosidase